MDVLLRHGERTLTVRLTATTATVEGNEHRLLALDAGAPTSAPGGAVVQTHALEIDGRVVEVVTARTTGRILVALAGRTYVFETGEESRRATRAGGSGMVVAPMPGKVLAVLVAEGDTVEAGQPLVVLEAMKMETTLAAEIAGRVHAVRAVAGATVDGGDMLVEIRAG